MKCNISIIYDMINNVPVGVFCINPKSGDSAYSTKNQQLSDVMDVLLDNKLFLMRKEKVNDFVFLVEESVDLLDSYYVMALSYSLPSPWWILDTYEDVGDVEVLSELYFKKICQGSESDAKIKENKS